MSGKSEAALRESSKALLAWLDEHEIDEKLADLPWSASVARSHFDFRDGVVFQVAVSLRQGLEAIAGSPGLPFLPRAARLAFVYTGEGNQWVGVGESLYGRNPCSGK